MSSPGCASSCTCVSSGGTEGVADADGEGSGGGRATPEITEPQVWELVVDGRLHRVETSRGGWSNVVLWFVDGELVESKKSSVDDALELTAPKGHELADEIGGVKARFTRFGRPRRVTHFAGTRDEAATKALVGAGGQDLDPEPGSKAARREEWAERHPMLASLDDILGGAGAILIPIAIAALLPLLKRLLPDWDLPSIPLPDWDLPSIPWPDWDLPSIPWPDWDLPDLPAVPDWLRPIVRALVFLWPVILGVMIAVGEHRRRKHKAAARAERQAALKRKTDAEDDPTP